MIPKTGEHERTLASSQRIEAGLEVFRAKLAPYVAGQMRDRGGPTSATIPAGGWRPHVLGAPSASWAADSR